MHERATARAQGVEARRRRPLDWVAVALLTQTVATARKLRSVVKGSGRPDDRRGFYDLIAAVKRHVAGGPGPKATLVALAEHLGDHDGEWTCWPSIDRLAAETEQSRRTVARHLAGFVADGLITRRARGAARDQRGGRATNEYVLHVDRLNPRFDATVASTLVPSATDLDAIGDTGLVPNEASLPYVELPRELPREREAPTGAVARLSWTVPEIVQTAGHLDSAIELCEYFADKLTARGHHVNGSRRAKAWVQPMELLLRVDDRAPHDVRRVIDWLDAGADEVSHFWRQNILSPSKLRLQWARLAEQHRAQQNRPSNRQAAIASVPLEDMAALLDLGRQP